MRFAVLCALLLLPVAGCGAIDAELSPLSRTPSESQMFGPASMEFHTFTQLKDWTADDIIDGIDAQIEFRDRFGDPTKASGTIYFELYDYRRADPDPRGAELAVWNATLTSLGDQKRIWNRISQTYGFQLGQADNLIISTTRSYYLSATFTSASGERLFAHTIFLKQEPESPATQPSTKPSTQPATAPSTRP